jgi:UDP-glucuronate decarboxylase
LHTIVTEDIREILSADLPWERFSGKTVLISGAAGFLPAYIVHTFLALNDSGQLSQPAEVIALVRHQGRAEAKFSDYIKRSDFQLLVHDVSEPLPALEQDVHYIIHAASQASPKYYSVDPVGTLSANVLGTYHLLNVARQYPIEGFLYFSSGEVYGEPLPGVECLDEKRYGYIDPMQVRACYGESKRMAENMCVSWWHQFKVPIKVVRPFHTYGPGMQLNDGRVFADFVSDVLAGRDIVMKSDGSAIRAFCYLVDATIGFFTVLLKGKQGEAYNVGNDQAVSSIVNLAEIMTGIFPEKNLKVVQKEPCSAHNYLKSAIHKNAPNIEKITQLGWKPQYGLSDGFERTLLSYNDTKSLGRHQ